MLRSRPEAHRKVDPAESLMREVGAQLRTVRLERGEDLEQVAEYLRIKPAYLHGIEQGDLSAMPGRTYALGFLRSYADYLGFDGEELIAQIKRTVENLTGRTRLHLRAPPSESRLPRTPVVVLSLAMLAGIYIGWSYMHRSSEFVVEVVAEIPDDLRHLAMDATPATGPEQVAPFPADAPDDIAAMPPADVAPGAARPEPALDEARPTVVQNDEQDDLEILPSMTPLTGARAARELPADLEQMERPTRAALVSGIDRGRPAPAPEAGPDGSEPAADVPVVRPAVLAAAPAEADGVTASVAGEGAADGDELAAASALQVVAALTGRSSLHDEPGTDGQAPQILEPVNADARVILRATATSWIHIASESGSYQRTRTLEPGDVFLVPNRPDLQLWTGNAGGLEIFVDGDKLPPLGAEGSVLRDVSLDPERLLARWQAQG